jgi:hypothetical protein
MGIEHSDGGEIEFPDGSKYGVKAFDVVPAQREHDPDYRPPVLPVVESFTLATVVVGPGEWLAVGPADGPTGGFPRPPLRWPPPVSPN